MTKPTPQENKVQIEVIKKSIEHIEKDISLIRIEVSNHIPTAIRSIENEIKGIRAEQVIRNREQDDKINEAMVKIASVTSIVMIIVQLILYFIQ